MADIKATSRPAGWGYSWTDVVLLPNSSQARYYNTLTTDIGIYIITVIGSFPDMRIAISFNMRAVKILSSHPKLPDETIAECIMRSIRKHYDKQRKKMNNDKSKTTN